MDRSPDDAAPGGTPHDLPRAAPDALGGDSFGRSLERWAADAAVDEAARTRIRERWMRVQAEESASMAGTFVDLAERRTPVLLEVGAHRARGVVVGVGADFVALHPDQHDARGEDVLVRMGAIDVVRTGPGGVDVRGDRSALLDVTLDAVMGPVAAERPTVLVGTSGGATVRGQLRSAGADVLSVRADGDPPAPTWIPLGSVTMLVIGV